MSSHQDQSVLTIRSDGQLFGLAVKRVVHVLKSLDIAPVPGSSAAIAGLINLRGHIIVAIDLRAVLSQPDRSDGQAMGVILDSPTEQVCLLVDRVGDVLDLSSDEQFETPHHISQNYIALADTFYRLETEVLIKLNEDALMVPEGLAA